MTTITTTTRASHRPPSILPPVDASQGQGEASQGQPENAPAWAVTTLPLPLARIIPADDAPTHRPPVRRPTLAHASPALAAPPALARPKLRRLTIVLVWALALAGALVPLVALAVATLPPCPTEDSVNCTYDGSSRGNGQGPAWVSVDAPGFGGGWIRVPSWLV